MATAVATPPHLGGHQGITWLDDPVLTELIRRYGVTSMLDVGCGPGGMLDLAADRGLVCMGIDGDPAVMRLDVKWHDYTKGPLPTSGWDLVWCVEFVEHVAAEYQENYLATFAGGKVLFLTAAYVGQGGHHHVNEQPDTYWIDLLEGRGWRLDEEATQWVRAHGAMPFARMTGMVFARSSSQP